MPKSVLFDRDDVISRVTDLFWEKGYNATSMQDLVDATGLNRSSIYNTYGDKYNLFIAALKHYQAQQNDLLTTAAQKTQSPKKAIEMLFNATWEQLNEEQNKGCFLSNCATEMSNADPKIKGFLSDNKCAVVTTFKSLIEKAQQVGEVDAAKDAEVLAHYLFSSLQGLRVTSMIDGNKKHIKGIADQVLSVL
ncbi:MAG: TetR/AcrR family transcriptional regulator [Fulvivirga sp.]|uniref:TetR/AcrR family transcriptional regulator n=1 Tax=Fulvivirga sp. TaxID=1931237 RepID=UPI0032EE4FE3